VRAVDGDGNTSPWRTAEPLCDEPLEAASLGGHFAEAGREGWTGEAEGLKVSLAAAEAKLAQADGLIARRAAAIDLGMPAYRDIAAATASTPGDRP
jgi:hypothetical protein